MMTDVDILILEAEIKRTLEVLAKLGYRADDQAKWHTHAYSDLYRPGETWSLDVHRYFGYQKHVVTAAEVWRDAVKLDVDRPRLLAPSPTHRVFHNMFHAQIQNQNYALGVVPLMQLYEFAILCRRYTEVIYWEYLRTTAQKHRMSRPLQAYVHLAVELLGLSRPLAIPITFGAELQRRRCLVQLRWPSVLSRVQRLGVIAQLFNPLYISSRYGCSMHPIVINMYRLRLAFGALKKHSRRIVDKANDLSRMDRGRYR
jgi:hypothetical protein